ncbi:MAG: glycosyltransferase family 4 protein [Cyclobacteriaceae bacterium]
MSSKPHFYFLTQYYPPETGAPQNRLHSLASFLAGQGFWVRVFTAMPNYPTNQIHEGYRGRWRADEFVDGVEVFRSWIFVPRSRKIVPRLLNYFSFVASSFFRLLFSRKAEFLFCESPPLFLGITAVVISRIKGMKLIFNVSDLWPESAEKLGLVSNTTVLKLAYGLEKGIYRKSWLITGQTKGIVNSIQSKVPDKKVVWLPNGFDADFVTAPASMDWRNAWHCKPNEFVVLYAGIVGHAQGLDVVLQAAREFQPGQLRFVIAGDGPEKSGLQARAKELGLSNVVFQDHVPRREMAGMIQACSAFVVPLRKLDLFKGAIPSKLFEPLALGKPILLGVDGEARELFIDEGKAGVAYAPDDSKDLAEGIRWLMQNPSEVARLGENGRTYVHTFFNRAQIHGSFLTHLNPGA